MDGWGWIGLSAKEFLLLLPLVFGLRFLGVTSFFNFWVGCRAIRKFQPQK